MKLFEVYNLHFEVHNLHLLQSVDYALHGIKEHGSLSHHIARTLTARRIYLGYSISSVLP